MESIDTTEEQIRHGTRVIIVGAVVNLFLAAFKFTVGILGHSTVMVADAIHSLSDLLDDSVVWLSLKISRQPKDENHPYGHGRAETIGEAVVGAGIVFVGLGMLYKFVSVFYNREIPEVGAVAITGAILSIVMKEWLFRYTLKWGVKIHSPSLVANAWQHRSDAFSSVAALVGISGALAGYPILDPLAALVVAFLIMKDGWGILWSAIGNLMDSGVSECELGEIRRVIGSTDGIVDFHELRTRRLGNDILVDVHVQVKPRISVSEGHNLAETVRHKLIQEVPGIKDVMVHLDPERDDPGRLYSLDREKLEGKVREVIRGIDGVIGFEDLVIHYLNDKVTLDLCIKMPDSTTIGECRPAVRRLERELLQIKEIGGVSVRVHVSGIADIPEDPVPMDRDRMEDKRI